MYGAYFDPFQRDLRTLFTNPYGYVPLVYAHYPQYHLQYQGPPQQDPRYVLAPVNYVAQFPQYQAQPQPQQMYQPPPQVCYLPAQINIYNHQTVYEDAWDPELDDLKEQLDKKPNWMEQPNQKPNGNEKPRTGWNNQPFWFEQTNPNPTASEKSTCSNCNGDHDPKNTIPKKEANIHRPAQNPYKFPLYVNENGVLTRSTMDSLIEDREKSQRPPPAL